MPMLRSII